MTPRSFMAGYRFLHFSTGPIIYAQIATRSQEQERGLMFLDSLDDNHGMLFEYPQIGELSFWMKNTYIPLSIAFIEYPHSRRGIIIDIQDMEPHSLESHRSRQPVRAALEVNQGWFDQHSIDVGDSVIW